MVFASFVFLFWFLPAFLPLYVALPLRWRNLWLTLGSLRVLRLVAAALRAADGAGSTLLDYLAARAMGDVTSGPPPQAVAVLSVVSNLGLLAWFKYSNLLVATWNDTAPWPIAWEQVLLPVGISFFTFQSMSYTIDVYRGEVKPVRSFLDLLCFVSMFPQLVAGPSCATATSRRRSSTGARPRAGASDGVFLFAIGFVKKVLIADQVAPLVAATFGAPSPVCSPRGSARSATRCRSTSTSPATATWRSGSGCCSASTSRATSCRRTAPTASPSSGGAGT